MRSRLKASQATNISYFSIEINPLKSWSPSEKKQINFHQHGQNMYYVYKQKIGTEKMEHLRINKYKKEGGNKCLVYIKAQG